MDVNRGSTEPTRRIRLVPQINDTHVQSALDDNIARDFAARTEGLLRFAVELGLDATGITEGQDKLVLAFPSGPLSRPKQGLLWAPAIDLNDDPTQLYCLKIKQQLSLRCR